MVRHLKLKVDSVKPGSVAFRLWGVVFACALGSTSV